jgi:hypothetical protein
MLRSTVEACVPDIQETFMATKQQKNTQSNDTDTTSPQALWQAGFDAMTQAASQALGPLEGLFGQRVAKAMSQMGMPAPMEVVALRQQVEALEARVAALEARLTEGDVAPKAARKTSRARAS